MKQPRTTKCTKRVTEQPSHSRRHEEGRRDTTHRAMPAIPKCPLGTEVEECLPGDGDHGGDKLALHSQVITASRTPGVIRKSLN